MTSSGAPPGDETGIEQERMWEDPAPPGASVDTPSAGDATHALTRRLTSTELSPGPGGLLYADVPNRIVALILDVIVLALSGFILAWLLGGLVRESGALDSAGGELDVLAFVVVLLLQLALSFAYFGSLWTLTAATLGMRLLGLRIGDESDGRLITWRQSGIRWLLLGVPSLLASMAVYVPNAIGLILGGLGVAWMLLLLYSLAQSPTKQGLHDRYAHTIVVKARRRSM